MNKPFNWDARKAPLETASKEEKDMMNVMAQREAERFFEKHRDKPAYLALLGSHIQRMLNNQELPKMAAKRDSENA